MTLYQFNALNEMEQAEVLWSKGVHIGERIDAEHKILFYQIDRFYVEVFYHQDYNVIRRMRSFASTDQLGPYLDQIKLD